MSKSSDMLIIGIPIIVGLLWFVFALDRSKDELRRDFQRRIDEQTKKANELERHAAEQRAVLNEQQELTASLQRLLKEKSAAMPWVGLMAADILWAFENSEAKYLRNKQHPARKAAEAVQAHAQEKKTLRISNRILEYRISLMTHYVPWLSDLDFEDAERLVEAQQISQQDLNDPASRYLTKYEWERLTDTERYQRALDRYKSSRKSDWEVGRDFERYVGYLFEKDRFDVLYHGAIEGFDDLGRDVIVKRPMEPTRLIQCKRWSPHKTIPEAAVFQLYGTTISYFIEENGRAPKDTAELLRFVRPCFYSTARISGRVRDIALLMGVEIKDDMVLSDWPMIKCNISSSGDRIYHLPMDQQYDRVKLVRQDEKYVHSVIEAERLGFRRAKRWGGNKPEP